MPADYKRINRLLHMYVLIQGGLGWTAKKLAAECGTVERNVYRDIKVLRDVGVPLYHDKEHKCYQIRRDFYMTPVDFTFDESLALLALGRQIHQNDQIPFSRAAVKAIAKIRGKLPLSFQRELDLVEDRIAMKLASSATQEGFDGLYELARKAIATGTALRCAYDSVSGGSHSSDSDEPETFLFKPYALFFNQRAWYIVGYHCNRDSIRTLKLNRFSIMEPTDHRYTIPKSFSLEKHLGNAWRMIRGDKSYDVELIFDPTFAETISDTAWHPTQAFYHLPDGSLRFVCVVDGLDEIVWWVLSMGSHCKVVSPPELMERVRAEAVRTASLYAPEATTKKATATKKG